MPKQRLTYLLLLLMAAVFYLCFRDYTSFAALVLAAALPALSWAITLFSSLWLRFRLETPRSVTVRGGEPGVLRLYAVNKGFLPITAARAVFVLENGFGGLPEREELIVPIGGRNTTRTELRIRSAHCGRLSVRLEWIRLYDFFCLLPVPRRLRLREELTVLPECLPWEGSIHLSSREGDGEEYSPWKRGDDIAQVFNYHEYQAGDRLKAVNWKLSARLDRLMVKEGSQPLSRALRIGIELAGSPRLSQLDLALGAFRSLGEQLTAQALPCEAAWKDGLLRLERPEDLGEALSGLYSSGSCQQPLLLEQMAAQEGHCSCLLYITTFLSVEGVGMLKQLRERMPVTVIYAAGEGAADPGFLRQEGLLGEEIPLLQLSALEDLTRLEEI